MCHCSGYAGVWVRVVICDGCIEVVCVCGSLCVGVLYVCVGGGVEVVYY